MTATLADAPFDVGDSLIYPQHGAGTVVERSTREILDEERDYLGVDLLLSDMRVWVPVDQLDEVGVRAPMGAAEADEIVELLEERDVRIPANFSRRFKNNEARLNSGDQWKLATVVRNLAIRRDARRLSPSEKRMYIHARQLLACELSLAFGLDLDDATDKMDEALPGDSAPASIRSEDDS